MPPMIISKKLKADISAMGVRVVKGMTLHQSAKPYLVDDEIINMYEAIRDVWQHRLPVIQACKKFSLTKSAYYEKEESFLKYGIVGLFPEVDHDPELDDLEELVLLVKKSRPKLSITGIFRITEAIPITKAHTTIDTISSILTSHGLSPSSTHSDGIFWGRFQRTASEITRLRQHPLKTARDRKNKRETFFDDQDQAHKRLDLLREIFFHPKKKTGEICLQYGISLSSYYRLIEDYREFGPWAVIAAPSYGKEVVSKELQLKIILHKRKHPHDSPQQIIDAYKLKCSRFSVNRILKRWKITDKKLPPIALDQKLSPKTEDDSSEWKQIVPAKHLLPEDNLLKSRKVNRHFLLLGNKMEKHEIHICNPGPIILAPFVNALGIAQSFETHGPERLRGQELTNIATLNVFRILAGYSRVDHLNDNKDMSVAFASGLGMYGTRSRFYEKSLNFKFSHLELMRNDLVAVAKELGLIEGMKIAYDFHFKEFYGKNSQQKGIGKGPDKSGNMVPGFRPHVAWDVATNAIISIAYYQGAIRSSTIIRQFCEQNIYPLFKPSEIKELYMDSEYTKEDDFVYLSERTHENGHIYVCLKRNKQIQKLIDPLIEKKEGWQKFDGDDEIHSCNTHLPHSGLPIKIVVLRDTEKGDNLRCFGSTNLQITDRELLSKYRCRWTVENGIKDLTQSYYLDETYGMDPEKVEFNYYCIMVARLAFEYFLKEMGGEFFKKPDGSRFTLNTVRNLLFEKRNCTLRLNPDGQYVLTSIDSEDPKWDGAITRVLERWGQKGKNKVLWWGNAGLIYGNKDQFRGDRC
jgi:hypothetical protein